MLTEEKKDDMKLNSTSVNTPEDEKGKPWSIAKQVERPGEKDEWIPNYEDVVFLIKSIPSLEDRAFVAIAYLSAGRVDEIVRSLTKSNINFEVYIGVECMVFRMRNLKNRRTHSKILPIPIEKEIELVSIIKEYLDYIQYPDDFLFPFSRTVAWRKMRNLCNCTNHWWRHIRLTHLKKYHHYDDVKLMKFAGWSDTRQAGRYTHYDVDDLVY